MKLRFSLVLLPFLMICSGSFAAAQESGESTAPTYHRGETVIERTMTPSPEAASRVKYADVPFTHSQGLAEYAIDFSTLKGRELSLPIRLSYRSSGSVSLESAVSPEGRLSETAAMAYVTDYLGSVRAVLDASDGTVYETSSYSAYGLRTQRSLSPPSGTTLRDHYTGCEDFAPEFGLPYTDHSARFYSASLHRWLVPDPQSEKYYGVSLYAYCGGNPLVATDRNGEFPHIVVGAVVGGLIGAAVETGIAYSQGKTGNELLGAAASGLIN